MAERLMLPDARTDAHRLNGVPYDETVVPPHSEQAEASLLGSLLLDSSKIEAVPVEPCWFYSPANEIICRTLLTLHSEGTALDPVTVSERLEQDGRLADAGGAAHVAMLMEIVPHSAHCGHYADIVRGKYLRRHAISRAKWIISELSQDDCDPEHVIRHSLHTLTESLGGTDDKFGGICVSELWDLAAEPVTWLVDNILSADQPTIFGAKQKALKTTLLTDLAVSLASGWPWLGQFDIPERRRVLFITGEASNRAAMRKVRRAAETRNVTRESLQGWLHVEAMNFPNLPTMQHCHAVQQAIQKHRFTVVILDPLYMGLQGVNTSNLTEVGPAMRQFMHACEPAAVIIAHHVKKSASFDDAPNLEDLSQAGIAEFAGNYWLMGRMGEYQGDGKHTLAVRYGGRDEQFGLLRLDFDEQKWQCETSSLLEHRENVARQKETERFNQWSEQALEFLTEKAAANETATISALAESLGTKPDRKPFRDFVREMKSNGRIEQYLGTSRNKKQCECVRISTTDK